MNQYFSLSYVKIMCNSLKMIDILPLETIVIAAEKFADMIGRVVLLINRAGAAPGLPLKFAGRRSVPLKQL
jgi:hypothetical protein